MYRLCPGNPRRLSWACNDPLHQDPCLASVASTIFCLRRSRSTDMQNRGAIVTTNSSTAESHPLPSSNRGREVDRCKRASSTGELLSTKLYSTGVRGAVAVVLSLV